MQDDLTNFHEAIDFQCPKGMGLSSLYSIHDNGQEDRRWRFGCKPVSSSELTTCVVKKPNTYDHPSIAGCDDGSVVTAFKAI